MSFLNELINSVTDEDLKEALHERVDIITHKLMFTEKVPVASLNADHQPHKALDYLIELAGGEVLRDPGQAQVILYVEHQTGIGALMSKVVAGLHAEWPAVRYNRVYLLDDSLVLAKEPQHWVEQLEDIAEMLHPGFFVFGNESERWVNFNNS